MENENVSKIKSLRKAAGLSQVELADMIGVSKQSLYKYEKGYVKNIPYDKLERIAQICHTTPQNLLGWEETETDTATDESELKRMRNYFIAMFERLDDIDKGRLIGNAEMMLKQSKYQKTGGKRK